MSGYGKVYRRMWSSPEFRDLTEDARILFPYLLTTEHGTSEGFFNLPVAFIAHDLQWDIERSSNAVGDLVRTGFVLYDDRTSTVLVTNALKFNAPSRPNNVKGAAKVVKDMRDTPLRRVFLDQCDAYCPALATILTSEYGWERGPADLDPIEPSSDSVETQSEPSAHSPSPSPSPSPTTENHLSSSQANTTRAADTQAVFDHWREQLSHPNAKLDAKRTKAITDRLKDGYTVDQLRTAIDGILLDPHKMGNNDRSRKFDDIELACRTAANVDALIDLATNGNPKALPAGNDRRARTKVRGDEWEARMADVDSWMTPSIEAAAS